MAVAMAEVKMFSAWMSSPLPLSRKARSPGVYLELFVRTRNLAPDSRSRAMNSFAPGDRRPAGNQHPVHVDQIALWSVWHDLTPGIAHRRSAEHQLGRGRRPEPVLGARQQAYG